MELNKKLNELINSMNAHVFEKKNKVPEWYKPLYSIINDAFNEISTMAEIIESKLSIQENTINVLEKDRNLLKEKLEDQQQYTRRNMLLIHGIPEEKNESTDEKAIKVFSDIGVALNNHDINRSHRIGSVKSNSSTNKKKIRPIIVSFISYKDRKRVYDAKRKLKNTKTVITESLTSTRYDLFKKCQEAYGKKNCWTYDGFIWVKGDDEEKHIIQRDDDIAHI